MGLSIWNLILRDDPLTLLGRFFVNRYQKKAKFYIDAVNEINESGLFDII